MLGSRTPLILSALLLFGAGSLCLAAGNALPILTAMVAAFLASLFARRLESSGAWISSLGAIAIFLSGTPLAGHAPEGLLASAVMALYFVCFVQHLKVTPLNEGAPSAPHTLTFYGTLLLAFLLLKNRFFPFPFIVGIFLASTFILGSLALWELGRRSRLAQAGQVENASLPDRLGRVCILAALLLGTFLLFRLPLPWVANGALEVARELNLTAEPPTYDKKPNSQEDRDAWNSQTDPFNSEAGDSDADETADNAEGWRRGRLPKQADLELKEVARLHVEIPDQAEANRVLGKPLYIRAHTLGVYDKDGWARANYAGRWVTDGEDGKEDGWVTLGRAPEERAIRQKLYLYQHLRGGALLSLTNTLAYRGDRVFRQNDDFLSSRESGDITYEIVSAPVHYDEVAQEKILEPGDVEPHLLTKAQGPTFRDIDNILLAPIQNNEQSLKQKLRYLRRLFETEYGYSLRVDNPGDHEPLANFLFHEKSGYCDFFAQAGAHMLRGIGVPSRVAYGYAGGVYDPAQKLYTFREKDAHAWTEMFLKGHGWVIFDLVPSGEGAHQPAEVAPISPQLGDPLRRFRDAEEARQQQQSQNTAAQAPSFTSDWEAWTQGLWIIRYLDLVLGLVVLALLTTFLIRRWRKRHELAETADRAAGKVLRDPPGYFRDFCELFAGLGHQRSPGQTLREYVAHLRENAQIRDEFNDLLEYHYVIEYEGGSRSKGLERQFRQAIRDFSRQ